jgi:hypothetical protein
MQWHEYLPHIKTQQQFVNACLENSQEQAGASLGKWAREQMMVSEDAIGRLAEILSNLLGSDANVPAVPSWSDSIPDTGIRRQAIMWTLSQRLRALLRRQKVTKVPDEYANDYLERDMIKTRIQRWTDILFDSLPNAAGSAE